MGARYGTVKYGSTTYGASPPSDLAWGLDIDWDNDGKWSGDNDAWKLSALSIERGRKFWVKASGNGFETQEIGRLDGLWENNDGRYDPYNTLSPLYPNIEPGRLFRLRVRTPAGNIYHVMTGMISDIRPDSSRAKRARVTGEDGIRFLRQNVSIAVQEGYRTDEAITDMLASIGWPATWGSDLDIGVDVRPYWWVDGRSAYSEIFDLVNSELGQFYLAADGKATFRNRNAAESSAAALDGTNFRAGIEVARPWEIVRNAVRVWVRPRVLVSAVEIWRYQEFPALAAGATLEIWADFTYNNNSVPAKTVTTPAATTDYTANSQSDGLGTDLTADISITMTTFGKSAKLEIKNNGAGTAYLTLMKLRGDVIDSPNATYQEKSSGTSINQTFTLDLPWIQSTTVAVAFVDFLLLYLSGRAFVRVKLVNQPDVQFGMDLNSLVDVSVADLGIAGTYRIAWIKHRWLNRTGYLVETEWLLEPHLSLSGSYWTFPTEIGVSSTYGV
ncbi:MAG: hypothetical protein C4583_04390 [Anaerolineaceae bacterium]|nr:MAG: hypothetical protein C4583_04390 [Anaerolineaceae bacterium]